MKTLVFIYRNGSQKPIVVEDYKGLRIATGLDYDGFDLIAIGQNGDEIIYSSRSHEKLAKLKRKINFLSHLIGNIYMPKDGKY